MGGVAELHGQTFVPEMKRRTYDWYLKLLPEHGQGVSRREGPGGISASAGHSLCGRLECRSVKVEANLTQCSEVPLDRFAAIVTGEDVLRRKPFPDIFLEAARRLNVPPEACCVIEDAVHGVEAAKTAGMRCVAVTTSFPAESSRRRGSGSREDGDWRDYAGGVWAQVDCKIGIS